MSRALSIAAAVMAQLLGCFFILSALGKFVSIEEFNVYVYSFGWFPWPLAVMVGWFAITAELILGLLLLLNRHRRFTYLAAILVTLGFSLFLLVAHFLGRTDSCHCMGELLSMNPLRSLLKNAVLVLLLLLSWKYGKPDWRPRWWLVLPMVALPFGIIVLAGFRGWIRMNFFDLQYSGTLIGCVAAAGVLGSFAFFRRWWVQLLLALVPLVAVFVLSAAANLLNIDSSTTDYDSSVLEEMQAGVLKPYNNGHRIVAFYSVGCTYCQKAEEKLSLMQKRNDLPQSAFVTVFGGDTTGRMDRFYSSPYAVRYTTEVVEVEQFLRLTRGRFPLIMLMDNGQVKEVYSSSSISEQGMVKFLKDE